MKKYELKYTKGDTGVFRMSTVESPATKTMLVMFDDELAAMEFQDDDKQIIYSVAMRPNMAIPRKSVYGEPAMVFYSEETVSDLQQNFFKNNSHNGATINHDKKVRDDIYFFESWIVVDPEKDKATSLGLEVKMGDWILGQKVDNPEVWADIKTGKLKGLSIEAHLEPVLIKTEMTIEEVDARIQAVLKEQNHALDYKVGDSVMISATPEIAYTVTEIKDDGTYSLTDADGNIKDAVKEEELMMPMAAKPAPAQDLQKVIDDLTAENNDLKAKITEMEAKATEMSAEIIATKKVAVEMGEEMAKGIKPAAAKPLSEMTAIERYRATKQ